MLRAISGNFSRQILVGLLQLGLISMISHRDGPDGVGAYTLAVLVPMLVAQILTFGLQTASVYFCAQGQFSIGTILRANLLVIVAVSSLFLAVAVPVTLEFGGTLFAGLGRSELLWGLASFPAAFAITILPALAQAKSAFRAYNLLLMVQPLAQLLVVAAIFVVGGGMTALVASFAFSNWLSALIMAVWMVLRWGLGTGQALEFLRTALRYGLLSHLGSIFGLINYRAVVWVSAQMLGITASGLYVLAMQPAEKLWLPSQAAATVVFPTLARLHVQNGADGGASRVALAGRMARFILGITLVLALVAAGVAEPLMVLLFGAKAAPAVGLFLILLPGIVAWAPSRILAHDIAAVGAARYNMWNAVITMTVNLTLMVPLMLMFGVVGAALATTLAYCGDLVVRSLFHARLTATAPFAWIVPDKEDMTRLWAVLSRKRPLS